jgi:hypothetical protein
MSPQIQTDSGMSSDSVRGIVLELLLCLFVAVSLPLTAQQAASCGVTPSSNADVANSSKPPDKSANESKPAVALKPEWVFSSDSEGNIRQFIGVGNDYAIGDRARLGMLYRQGFIYNVASQSNIATKEVRDAGVTGEWHPNEVVKVEGMVGVSQTGTTVDAGGETVPAAIVPISNVQATFTPAGDAFKLDLGFKRAIFDLSPQLVANRVVRNDFILHPQLGLSSGWRFRELAEIGPVEMPGQSNNRYNSESTVARQLGKNSELYTTLSMLHYREASDAGYFSPDLAQNLEAGWSTDLDRKRFSLSLDFGMGSSREREHGSAFGPWGISGHAETDLTWRTGHGHELRASCEYYYDQSTPAVESPGNGPWHMVILKVSFRWASKRLGRLHH